MGGPANNFFYRTPKELSNSILRSTNKKNIVQRRHNSNSSTSLLQRSRARVTLKSTKCETLRKSVLINYHNLVRPNQSLKLTEVAVGDFAARQYPGNDMISGYIRATDYMELTVRRRSLAPVR